MNSIESAVASIPYEEEPSFPFQYSAETIAACEELAGKSFPEDFTWYLQNIGWRKIAYGHRSLLIENGDYLYHLQFEAVEHQAFLANRYKEHLESDTELPENKAHYFPFGKISGEINPAVSYQLLMSLNNANAGTIWAVKSGKEKQPPLKIAENFAAFLTQLGDNYSREAVAKKNNEILFTRLLENYLISGLQSPTTAMSANDLLLPALQKQQPIVINGARNIEFQHFSNAMRVESETMFAERAAAFANTAHTSWLLGSLQRTHIKISVPVLFDREEHFRWNPHHYYLVAVESTVGDHHLLKEAFLLHHDPVASMWTMVRRYQAVIGDVKVKGVGTFSFDAAYKWELNKKVTPAWSELPAELSVEGEEDAMTQAVAAFIKEVLTKADFRPALETFIFHDYQTAYPEFEAMPEDEKTEWADQYPQLNSPQEIWPLLGQKWRIVIESPHVFRLHTHCSWDQEHGIMLKVKHWVIGY